MGQHSVPTTLTSVWTIKGHKSILPFPILSLIEGREAYLQRKIKSEKVLKSFTLVALIYTILFQLQNLVFLMEDLGHPIQAQNDS